MTVSQLIRALTELNTPDASVRIFDADSEKMEPVTGIVFGGDSGVVDLYSDDIE